MTPLDDTMDDLPGTQEPDTSAAMGAWLLATWCAVAAVLIAYGLSPLPFVVLAVSFGILSAAKALSAVNHGALRRHDQALTRIDRTLATVEDKLAALEERA